MPPAADEPLRFETFEIRPAERALLVAGQSVVIGARAFDLLLALARRRERLVTKQELLEVVWPRLVVEEHNIAAQISGLRKVLGPNAISTVPGRGYRLTARFPDQAAGVNAAPAISDAAPRSASTPRSRLPAQLTPLLGRVEELAALARLIDRCRLVSVLGAGGVGKTLLTQHLLRGLEGRYTDGVCWIELASVADARELPLRIAEALGVRLGDGDPLAILCAALSPLNLLIALDNAEHLLDDVARIVAALLDGAPSLRAIVTSQAPLRLAAEHVYRVGPLDVPRGPLPAGIAQSFAAVALFVERARAADARFALTDTDAPAAIALCRELDGLPLAIELAAARAPVLGVAQLSASMQDRLRVLTRNRDTQAPARQQTLRAALEWSHGFLDDHERTVFRRLAVVAGSTSLPFAQRVVADAQGPLDAWAVLDALETLIDRSLVAVLGDDEDAGAPRYRLLESPRTLALEQLRAAGEEPALRRTHAQALVDLFDAAWEERWCGRVGVQRWAARVAAEADNARAALAWARAVDEPSATIALAATLFFALPRTVHAERMALADLCEALAKRVARKSLRLRALMVAVRPMLHPSQPRSLGLAESALALARELDAETRDRWPLYLALCFWIRAAAVVAQPDSEGLRAAVDELVALEDASWPAQRLTQGIEARRLACLPLGGPEQPARSLEITRELVATLERAGDETTHCMSLLVDAELECGHAEAAIEIGERALAQLAGSRDEWSRMLVRCNLASAYLACDDVARGRALMQEAWPAAVRVDMHALCSDYLALIAALENRPVAAARLAGYADAAYAKRGLIRHPNEAAARARSYGVALAALGNTACDVFVAEGRALRAELASTLAFGSER